MAASDARIRFGSFEADPQTKELFKEGARIPLANQSFIALATLLERPGQLVSREELRQRLWPDNRVVDFEQGMNAIINRLREALGAGPGGAGLIETLPRRGYRFVGTVQVDGRAGTHLSRKASLPAETGRPELMTHLDRGAPSTESANTARLDQRAQPPGPAAAAPIQPTPATLPVSTNTRRPITLAISLGALVVALLGWATASWLTRASHPPLTNLKLTPLTSLVGREVAPDVKPAGDTLLFA